MKKFFTYSVFLSIVVTGTIAWTYSHATSGEIVGCVAKNGILRILGEETKKDSCKENEKQISWNSEGTPGLQGVKGDQGEQGLRGEKGETGERGAAGLGLHLFDANNQNLGLLIQASASGDSFTTFIESTRIFVSIRQNRDNNDPGSADIGGLTGAVYFLWQNCQGEPYTSQRGSPPGIVVSSSGRRFFKYTAAAAVLGTNPRSQLDSQGCINGQHSVTELYPLEELPQPFNFPLKWPFEIKSL